MGKKTLQTVIQRLAVVGLLDRACPATSVSIHR
jgi:hypothetical protein